MRCFTCFSATHGREFTFSVCVLTAVHKGQMQRGALWESVLPEGKENVCSCSCNWGDGEKAPGGPLWSLPQDFMLAHQLQREEGKICSYCFCFGVLGPAAGCKMRTWPWSKRKAFGSFFLERFIGG